MYSRWLSVGNEWEQDQYLHGLPRTVAGLLERTLARPKDTSHLRALAARIENSPDEAEELLSLLIGVLSSDLVPGGGPRLASPAARARAHNGGRCAVPLRPVHRTSHAGADRVR